MTLNTKHLNFFGNVFCSITSYYSFDNLTWYILPTVVFVYNQNKILKNTEEISPVSFTFKWLTFSWGVEFQIKYKV
jgi:hypothetical protein